MSRLIRLRLFAGLLLGGLILLAGIAYTLTRERSWESSATVALVPDPRDEEERTILLEAFDRSGTIGTFVELLSSRDVLNEAGVGSASVAVRAIPDARVIEITATSEQPNVQGLVESIIATAESHTEDLGSLWAIDTLESPGGAVAAGPPDSALIAASLLLGVLGTIAGFVLSGELLRRLPPRKPEVVRLTATGDEVHGTPGRRRPRSASLPHQ